MTQRPLAALLPCLVLALAAPPLAAQVGHAPDASPFGDIRPGTAVEFWGGQAFGSGGPIPVGPRDGTTAGARIQLRAKNTLSIGFGGWWAGTERNIVDADLPVAERIRGPIPHRLFGGEATVQFNLTGGKHWRGIAPFAGVGIGGASGQGTPPADTSGYTFGTKFYFAPMVGTRLIVSSRAWIRLEARAYFWNLKYPPSYAEEPALDPGTEEQPNAVNPSGRRSQYVAMPALLVGFGWGL